MAKEKSDLNKVYDEILGKGEPVQVVSGSGKGVDPAYMEEDYSDDEGSGVDPRDESTENNAEDKDIESQKESGSEESEDSEETEEQDGEGLEEEIIPERLVQAGRMANLPDETIIELAETKPHVLEALANAHESVRQLVGKSSQLDGAKQQDGLDESKKDTKSIEKLQIDFGNDEDFSPTAKKVVQTLVDKVNSLTEVLDKHDQGFGEIHRQRQIEGTRKIDTYFDTVAKDVPLLGKASSLTKEQTEARLFAYRIARGAQQTMDGLSDEAALAIGVNALKGQLTEQQVRTKVVQDINSQKKRFIARPKGRRQIEAKGKSVEERSLAAISKILDDPSYTT